MTVSAARILATLDPNGAERFTFSPFPEERNDFIRREIGGPGWNVPLS